MAVSVGDVFLVTLEGVCNDQVIMLTLGYEVATLVGASDESLVSKDLAERLSADGADILQSDYLNCLGNNYTLDYIHAQKIYPARYRRESEPVGAPGTGGANATTSNLAMVISLHGAEAGRDQVANKHIGPIPTDVLFYDEGVLEAAGKAAQIALANSLLLDVGAAGWYTMKPVIIHRADVIPKADYVTGHVLPEQVRVMRRRTVRVGI